MRLSGRRGKRQELKKVVETSTTSVRVNTCSDAGKESVWGAPSHGSKHRNNKLQARRLNTMVSLRAERGGAKLPAQGCRLHFSQPAPQWMNARGKGSTNHKLKEFLLHPSEVEYEDTDPCSALGCWGVLFCSALSCFSILLPVCRVYVQTGLGKLPLLFSVREGGTPFFYYWTNCFLKWETASLLCLASLGVGREEQRKERWGQCLWTKQ